MAKFNIPAAAIRDIKNQVQQTDQFKKAAEKISVEVFESAKKDFLDEFENHPITKEIESGPGASNLSGTLTGYGNLFSFIGFNSTDQPIEELRTMLKSMMRVSKIRVNKGAKSKVSFNISMPEMKIIMSATPMPWESGRSWVRGVERGISGFGYYMSTQNRRFSRSGTAIQADSRIRPGAYIPRKYMSEMLKNLDRNLRRLVK
tara:strand:+ start:503 stop:1111 length:609 start_codon:yes stop_codon:yes gene_type:complete